MGNKCKRILLSNPSYWAFSEKLVIFLKPHLCNLKNKQTKLLFTPSHGYQIIHIHFKSRMMVKKGRPGLHKNVLRSDFLFRNTVPSSLIWKQPWKMNWRQNIALPPPQCPKTLHVVYVKVSNIPPPTKGKKKIKVHFLKCFVYLFATF